MLTHDEWRIINYLSSHADERSSEARVTADLDHSSDLLNEALGIRSMVIDLLDKKHRTDDSTD